MQTTSRLRTQGGGGGEMKEKIKGGLMCICGLQLANQTIGRLTRRTPRQHTGRMLTSVSTAIIYDDEIGMQSLPHFFC